MVFWLVLAVYGANVQLMHVGNFKTLASCEDAGRSSTHLSPKGSAISGGAEKVVFFCVQANELGTTPPNSR